MIKQDSIIQLKVRPDIKEKIRQKAESLGAGMSGFCKHIILRELNKEDQVAD